MKVLIIDNYDSFTYNLVQCIGAARPDVAIEVYRNDEICVDAIERRRPSHLVISPGPGTPADAGVSLDVVRRLAGRIPMLGVCLGMQCIAESFGAGIVRGDRIVHGKTSQVSHDGRGVFAHVPDPFEAMRYHSLVIDRATVPDELEISATTERSDEIMGIRHRRWPVEGVQFHPESFLTRFGSRLLLNFLSAEFAVRGVG